MRLGYDKIVLLIVVATSFMTPVMGSALNIAIPSIGREFSASATMLSWIATGYILATASCLLPAGRFADIRGRSRIYTAGILLFSGSLYFLTYLQATVQPGLRWVGAITPFGGVCFIGGWFMLFLTFFRKK